MAVDRIFATHYRSEIMIHTHNPKYLAMVLLHMAKKFNFKKASSPHPFEEKYALRNK